MSAPAAASPALTPGVPAASIARSLLASRPALRAGLRVAPLPGAVAEALVAQGEEWLRSRATVSWEQPDKDTAAFGFGEALRLRGEAGQGPLDVAARMREVLAACRAEAGPRLRLFGGMCFDPDQPIRDPRWKEFGDWQFMAPTVLLERSAGKWSGSVALRVEGSASEDNLARQIEADLAPLLTGARDGSAASAPQRDGAWPADDAWLAAVAEAVREIRGGDWRKLVLARSVTVSLPHEIERGRLLTRLAGRYGNCFIYQFQAGLSAWVGATPELLISLRSGVLAAACLAGSRPRNMDPVVDARLSAELLGSAKERSEHAFTLDAIREWLGPLCSRLEAPDSPAVMRMANIQHLYTPVSGPVQEGVDIFHLVAALHPTPAVGGWPRERSREAIRRLEGMDRGWYAAPVGWVDDAGDGEFAVALRSALVRGRTATLYAGAGIVAGSEPAQELAETELKLRPLWEALKES